MAGSEYSKAMSEPAVDSPWIDDIEERSNLSRSQMLIWLGQTVDQKSPLYNSVFAWRLHGNIDTMRFEEAFNRLVTDCDALRTIVTVADSAPRQDTVTGIPAPLEHVDLTERPEDVDDWMARRARRRLRLGRCTYDSALVKLGDDEFVWYLNQHHIVTDFSSWALLFERLAASYEQPDADSRRPPAFQDYVRIERETRSKDRTAQARAYWQSRVDPSPPEGLIYGRLPVGGAISSVRHSVFLDAATAESIRTLGARPDVRLLSEDVTLFSIFAVAELAWLRRASRRDLLTVGVPVHNRSGDIAKATPGLLIEVLPLQVKVDDDETFASLLDKVRRASMELLGNALPGITTPETSRSYDIVLNYIAASMPRFGNIEVTSRWIHPGAADRGHKLRLQVHDFDRSGRYQMDFDFDARTFDEATRDLAVRHYMTILRALLDDLDSRIESIDLLSDEERARNVLEFNDTDQVFPVNESVAALVSKQARETPDAIAVQEGQASWTYRELEERSNQIAVQLQESGAEAGKAVLICMERSMNAVASILAVIKTGAAYVPLDTRHPPARIESVVEDLCESTLQAPVVALSSAASKHLVPEGVPVTVAEEIPRVVAEPIEAKSAPDDLVYLIYTSGSTGRPKGVMISQRAMVNYLCWAKNQYCGNEAKDFALHSSLAVDLTVTSIFVPLLSGGRVVIYPDRGEVDLPVMQVFADDAVDVVKLTPAHLALIREAGTRVTKIRTLILGGEDLKTDLVQSVSGQLLDGVSIYNEYGPTEATVGCMIHRFDANNDTDASVPIGKPIANAKIYVIDALGRPAASGLTGELCIAGDGIAIGYLNRDEQTNASFVEDPVADDGRMYRSGDLARFNADGRLEFLGRCDDQVKIRGTRIELGDVEAALAAHTDVVDVVATVSRPEERHVDRCTKCGVPSNYPGIVFNERRVCSMCLAFDLFEDQARAYFRTMEEFRDIAETIRQGADSDVHCLALVSGGKDSTYMLYQLVASGLRPLLFTFDNGYISEEALANVVRAADDLGLELVIGSTPHMNEIFADSLNRYSNVCHGCFKTIYTLSLKLARERGLGHVVTGLSRGQIFETRLDDLFRHRVFDIETIEKSILEARKVYHRVDDAVARTLDVEIFSDDSIFKEIQFVDFYRYCEVELDEIYDFLETRAPWIRPSDTGRSTNCLVNDVGIYVHKKERGYHNYALPYSWDVRIGHKNREAALYELDDELDVARIYTMLDEIGYHPKAASSEPQLTAYFTSRNPVTTDELRKYMATRVPRARLIAVRCRCPQPSASSMRQNPSLRPRMSRSNWRASGVKCSSRSQSAVTITSSIMAECRSARYRL
jgi:amino acid adenylation domain-containing protein